MSSQFLSIMVKDNYGLVVAYCLIIKQLNRPTFDGMVKNISWYQDKDP